MTTAATDEAQGGDALRSGRRPPLLLRHLFHDAVIFGLVRVVDKAIGLLLLPITTAYLGPDDYGVLNLFGVTVFLSTLLVGMGLETAAFREYAQVDTPTDRRRIVGTVFWLVTVAAFVLAGGLTLSVGPLERWLFAGAGVEFVVFVGLLTYLRCLAQLGAGRLQADGRARTFLWVALAGTIPGRAVGLLLVIRGHGALGWVLGEMMNAAVTVTLLGCVAAASGIREGLDRYWARRLLPYGLALLPGYLAHGLMDGTDSYLLRALADDPYRAIGLYAVGQRLAAALALVNTGFVLGWRRFAFGNLADRHGGRRLTDAASVYLLLAGYAAVGLSVLGDDLVYWWLPADFFPGSRVIPLLTLGALCWGMTSLVGIGLHKAGRADQISLPALVAAGLNVVLSIGLIPSFGIVGAASATLLAHATNLLLTWWQAQRLEPLPFPKRRLAWLAASYGVLGLAGGLVSPTWLGWPLATGSQMILLLVAPFALYRLPVIGPRHRAALRRVLRSLRRQVGARRKRRGLV